MARHDWRGSQSDFYLDTMSTHKVIMEEKTRTCSGMTTRILFAVFLLFSGQRFLFAGDDEKWNTQKSEHFIVYYKEVKEDFVRKTVENAEEYYKSIAEELGFTRYNFWRWDNRAKIYIYNNAEDYQEKTGKPSWSGGVASYHEKAIETYPWAQGFFQSLLPHELGHIIFREFIGIQNNAPIWLDEGVAMYQEKFRRKDIKKKLLKAIEERKLIPLTKLSEINIMFVKDTEVVDLYYTEAISVVEYLITKFGRDNFVRLCKALKERKNFDQAIEESYRVFKNLEELDKGWLRYVKE
ncbi:MAG TPA: hypothetical protein DCL49_09375 [Candidatus Omnitrophica bacterium]|nr:hypothetical protein [Candidatus Omnitrophota bacterium]HBG63300.1 hypothetical protein [Candidatus Omnitrophota bacterium]HCD38782.1 hypothetical protein [Candidatus Omnitrophota bacterium]